MFLVVGPDEFEKEITPWTVLPRACVVAGGAAVVAPNEFDEGGPRGIDDGPAFGVFSNRPRNIGMDVLLACPFFVCCTAFNCDAIPLS